jgi:hypothetical protein
MEKSVFIPADTVARKEFWGLSQPLIARAVGLYSPSPLYIEKGAPLPSLLLFLFPSLSEGHSDLAGARPPFAPLATDLLLAILLGSLLCEDYT